MRRIILESQLHQLRHVATRIKSNQSYSWANLEPGFLHLGEDEYCEECLSYGPVGRECRCQSLKDHTEVCEAFSEFWDELMKSTDEELELDARSLAEVIAERRGILLAYRWAWLGFKRRRILRAVQNLEELSASGQFRLLLLCHCPCEMPCHLLLVQRYLVEKSTAARAAAAKPLQRPCTECACGNATTFGALAPDKKYYCSNAFYCSPCWQDYLDWLGVEEDRQPLPPSHLLAA